MITETKTQAVPISVLIVDDQEDMRFLIRRIIDKANEGLFVAGEASSGRDAIISVEDSPPTVVILDQMMPGMTGIDAARQIRLTHPGQLMILCSAFLDGGVIAHANAVGINVCLKKEDLSQIPQAIRELAGLNGPR